MLNADFNFITGNFPAGLSQILVRNNCVWSHCGWYWSESCRKNKNVNKTTEQKRHSRPISRSEQSTHLDRALLEDTYLELAGKDSLRRTVDHWYLKSVSCLFILIKVDKLAWRVMIDSSLPFNLIKDENAASPLDWSTLTLQNKGPQFSNSILLPI